MASIKTTEKDRLLTKHHYDVDRDDEIQYKKLPFGIWLLERAGVFSKLSPAKKKKLYQITILVLTFCLYASLHMARMTSSVVKSTLHPKCDLGNSSVHEECSKPSNHCNGWEPFDNPRHGKALLGVLDYVWLFPYALAMFVSGQIADHSNLRYYLTIGMLGSALSVGLFGMAYFIKIHQLYYFILIQILGGTMQSTGWPGVVAVMANWFGKGRRGLIMGVWNCHVSVGNLMGVLIPGIWAHHQWGFSFLSSFSIMICVAILIFFFLVIDPRHLGLPPPRHQLEQDLEDNTVVTEADLMNKQTDNSETAKNSTPHEYQSNSASVNADKEKAIKFWHALKIPGVIESSVALFFSKLVIYSFLFWLPFYVKNNKIGGYCLSTFQSAALSSMFDVGAMIGSIIAGFVSDLLRARAVTSVASLVFAIPSLFLFRDLGSKNLGLTITLMIITGIFVNGPYAMITTAVSADLGTHKSLRNNQKAKATVTAIIDGTGSIGGAVGPLLTGVLVNYESWNSVFYLFMGSSLAAALVLSRLVYREVKMWRNPCTACKKGQLKKNHRKRSDSSEEFITDLHDEEVKLIH